ncbi:hypothetical protein [Oricola nitratireducens]|uniref:hypothetical protein n=1 Tax=Oricola nitratireducens TaxID=2775868 RepID=UPI0018661B45|nr:hypothetical protein [Oricola nitratireducens]
MSRLICPSSTAQFRKFVNYLAWPGLFHPDARGNDPEPAEYGACREPDEGKPLPSDDCDGIIRPMAKAILAFAPYRVFALDAIAPVRNSLHATITGQV